MGPYGFFLPPVFDALPEAVADRLLAGVFGRKQAAQTGLCALRAARSGGAGAALLARLGLELSLLAFDLDPVNGALAQGILAMTGSDGTRLSEADRAALHLAASKEFGRDWREALDAAGRTGKWEDICLRVETDFPDATAPLALRLAGLSALAAGDAARLAVWRERLPAGPRTPGLAFLQARAACLLEGPEAGSAALRAFLDRYPWCAQTLLSLHDLACGRDKALTPLPGRLAILLYSWNKAEELGPTLEGILASDLPDFRMFVLRRKD